ncbi:MAG: DUF835 domain-containing protein [Spirochaetales bacterium]|nr:DUF835 domain-containing protein [Spirochaetales bacterium]
MGDWHLVPWTVQYLIGAVIIIFITVPIFVMNHKSWAYRAFLGFGLSVFFFNLTAFLHRNAPDMNLSAFFYRIDIFTASLLSPFFLIMILFLWKKKIIYTISLLPGAIFAIYGFLFTPFKIIWSSYGWSYVFHSIFNILFTICVFLYNISILILIIYLLKKIPLKILRKKFKIMIIGVLLCNVGISLTNLILQSFPEFPPFGGVWFTTQFIFIAVAITLKEDRIKLKLENVYTRFLSAVFDALPGRGLGQNLFEFSRYLHFTGISDFVAVSGDSFIFDKTDFYKIDLVLVLEKNLQYLENGEYRMKVFRELQDLFSEAYSYLYAESKEKINEVFKSIIQNHKKILLESNILYNLGIVDFLELITEDSVLPGTKKYEQLKGFYEKLRLALNSYSRNMLDDRYRTVFDMKKKIKTNFTSLYMEYNVLLYDRYNYVRGKTIDFEEGFIHLTAQVLRLHNKITKNLPVIPVFFIERLLNELYSAFWVDTKKIAIQGLTEKDKSFSFLKISGNRIYFPFFDECIYRNRLIYMCKVFVKSITNRLNGKSLKQFYYIMDKFSIPYAEVVIESGKIHIIKNNLNLGYLLFKNLIQLGYSALYIGKEVEGLTGECKNTVIIEKISLLDELRYKNHISFNNLEGLLKIIKKFIKENTNTVVMLNSIDDILYINSFKKVISFLNNISKIIEKKDARFIIAGHLLILNEDEEQLIENRFALLHENNFYYSIDS